MSERIYSVYLVERAGEQGGQREVTSPVEGHELEFYDTGVWLNRDRGRNFFPYEQIRTIREHAGEEGERTDGKREQADEEQERPDDEGERADEQREHADDTPDGVDGQQGAEEELLE